MNTWQLRQRHWKTILVNAGITQKQFCLDNNINEVSFSNWVSGRTRCNKENEEVIEELMENYK